MIIISLLLFIFALRTEIFSYAGRVGYKYKLLSVTRAYTVPEIKLYNLDYGMPAGQSVLWTLNMQSLKDIMMRPDVFLLSV